jgi:serine/threonine-protein kinase
MLPAMSALEPAAELLRRVGALRAEDVVRYLVETCEALTASGPSATVTLDSLKLSESPEVKAALEPKTFDTIPADARRAQVRAVAALGYELLKGMPPPETPGERDWIGERPELVQLLAPALAGTGAADVTLLAHQLRTLARPSTASHGAPPRVADTVPSVRSESALQERAGEVLGAYELVRRLGSGGMGDVYLARHVRLGREVAVKILKPDFAAQPDIVHRFFQEAKVVNEINHPHIVEIHDFVEEPGRVYLVMELLQGRALVDLVTEERSLGVRRAAALFSQVCDALDAAHRRGVVHRDVKPDNIFVSTGPDGSDFVKVLDFGIARRLSAGGSRTVAGAVMGTPFYMAPEQAAGRPVDARADLYSVGVALYEALSGTPPERIGHPAPLHSTRKGEPVPDELSELIHRCLDLDPARRPGSAADVRDVLKGIAGAPVAPRPTTDALAAAAGLGPAKTGRALLAVVLVAAVVVTVVVLEPAFVSESPSPAPATKVVMTAPPPAATPETPKELPPTPPPPVKKVVAKAVKPPPAAVVMVNPFAARAEAVRRRYDELVARFGASQLTTLEKAAVAAALDDMRADRQSGLAESLAGAESALDAADKRLSR